MNIDLKQKAIEGLLWQKAYEDLGIYPNSISGGPTAYEKRSERMEGWNDAVLAVSDNFDKICEWRGSIPEESRDLLDNLLLEERLEIHIRKDGCEMLVDCSDTFYWGYADCEEIAISDLPSLADCYHLSPRYGGGLWVCRKRGMRPQAASYRECYPKSEWHLFDACGPERDDPDGKGL